MCDAGSTWHLPYPNPPPPCALALTRSAGQGVFRGLGDTRTPLAATLGCNAANLVLNPLLIFGLGWGVAGAAQATVLAEVRAGPGPAPMGAFVRTG